MLFDLQSPRRRRVVRITFGALAAVFAISFVFLGVGTGGAGFSISDLFGGGGGGDPASAFDDQINAAEDQLQANPADTAALATLINLHYSAGVQSVDESGALTTDGEQQLEQSVDYWNRYVKLTNGEPDQGPALIAVQANDGLATTAFNEARSATAASDQLNKVNTAVADWQGAAAAQRVLVEKRPTGPSYERLAYYLYLSGQPAEGDQAAAQAKQTAKGAEAASVDSNLAPIKKLGDQLQQAIKKLNKQQQQQQVQGATGGGNPLGGLGGGGGLGGTGGLSGGP